MLSSSASPNRPSVGLIGFGAFGRLIARHLAPHADLKAYDPRDGAWVGETYGAERTDLRSAAQCAVVILAVPVRALAETIDLLRPHLRAGALVLDVGSVKVRPVEIMKERLPRDVEILGTHPLFGPESARGGIGGLKIALCPVRGKSWRRAAAFLRRVLRLDVIVTTPDDHDREIAAVQGLTHLIAKLLVGMEPLPARLTTRSYERLMEAVGMVRNDAPEVFEAILQANSHVADIRRRFVGLAMRFDADLDEQAAAVSAGQAVQSVAVSRAKAA